MLIRNHPLPEIDPSERGLQNLKDSLAAERREGVRGTPREPGGHRVIRHFIEMRLIDPEVLKRLRDPDRTEEFRGLLDRFLGIGFHAVRGVEPEDIHAVLGELRSDDRRVVLQAIPHPGRRNDRETDAVRDVVPGGELVLDSVAGPGTGFAPHGKEPAAPEGTRREQLTAGLKVRGILDRHGGVLHHGAQHRFAKAV